MVQRRRPGRPRTLTADGTALGVLTLRLPEDLELELRAIARAEDRPMARVYRELLREGLAMRREREERAS